MLGLDGDVAAPVVVDVGDTEVLVDTPGTVVDARHGEVVRHGPDG